MSSSEVLYVRSSKKKSKPNGDDGDSTNDDVWDDTLLIKAYDEAVNLAHNKVVNNMQNSLNKGKDNLNKTLKRHEWKKGDHCRCQYGEDAKYYEADIIDIIDDVGLCIVKYLGYENEEKVPLQKLKPSKGETYRSMQIKQALQEDDIKGDASTGKDSDFGRSSRPVRKRNNGRGGGKEKCRMGSSSSLNDIKFTPHIHAPSNNMPIPPPPPPHMFANLAEDVTESEAMSAMLMAWYMSGYHTGYYQGLKTARKKRT